MTKKRRRFKQTTSLQERLSSFAQDAREQAAILPAGPERDDLLKRANRAETAAQIDEWTHGIPSLGFRGASSTKEQLTKICVR
jgi:hypothetical protein